MAAPTDAHQPTPPPKTLAELPPPDAATVRRLLALLSTTAD